LINLMDLANGENKGGSSPEYNLGKKGPVWKKKKKTIRTTSGRARLQENRNQTSTDNSKGKGELRSEGKEKALQKKAKKWPTHP